jgi:hypothetical protein
LRPDAPQQVSPVEFIHVAAGNIFIICASTRLYPQSTILEKRNQQVKGICENYTNLHSMNENKTRQLGDELGSDNVGHEFVKWGIDVSLMKVKKL